MTEPTPQGRLNVTNTIFILVTPLIALVGTPWYLLTHGLGLAEVLTFAGLWVAIALSVTAGYHRLYAHKTYQAAWPVRLFYLVFGAAAFENSVLNWAGDHRIHHDHVDEEKDPYNINKGFWWAHMGWIFFEKEQASRSVVRDLVEDPMVVWQDRWYPFIAFGVAFGIPLVVGLRTGNVIGCLLIAGVLRVVCTHHVSFFINSLCHMIGKQPYSQDHSARDSTVMAVLAFGEGYHNYHHSFPFDYRNGIRRWHFDPAKWSIFLMSRIGLVKELRRAPEAAILKAKIEIQFQTAKERMQKVVHDLRVQYEARLHEAHASLQKALQDLHALQRRQKPQPEAGEENLPFETRVGLTYHALEKALQEWKKTLRQT